MTASVGQILGVGRQPGELTLLQMRARADITEDDISKDMRLKTNMDDFKKLREARIERNGEISIIPVKD